MAQNKAGITKDRQSNFTKEETEKLTLLLQDHPLITSKKTDHASNQQKETAWRGLAQKFNSDAVVFRSVKQLQQKFNNLKKTARKEMSAERCARRQTGGGPPPAPPSVTTEWLNTIMSESISGLPAVFDCDALVQIPITNNAEAIQETNQDIINDADDTENILNDPEIADMPHKYNEEAEIKIFDSSTPKSMLRKPISKELLTTDRKKKSLTPYETRKKIIDHLESKKLYIIKKSNRDTEIMKFAAEQHAQTLAEQQEKHVLTRAILEEQRQNQAELHQLEIEHKKQMQEIALKKALIELRKLESE